MSWVPWILFALAILNVWAINRRLDSLHEWLKAHTHIIQSLGRSQDLNDQQFRALFSRREWQRKPGKEWRQ